MMEWSFEAVVDRIPWLIDQVNDNSRVQYNGKNLLDGASSPLYSTKYDKKDLIARGLNSAWIRDSLSLIENTYGLSFTSNTSSIRQMNVYIDDDNSNGADPVSASISGGGSRIDLRVNASYFDENYMRNANGVSTDENGIYFDRQIARGLTEAVLRAMRPTSAPAGMNEQLSLWW